MSMGGWRSLLFCESGFWISLSLDFPSLIWFGLSSWGCGRLMGGMIGGEVGRVQKKRDVCTDVFIDL